MIKIKINIPMELPDDFANLVADMVIKQMDERIKFLNKTLELPPYPNKNQLKKILGIGDLKINQWVSEGLPVIEWSEKEHRFDREDIKNHINSMKV